MNNQNAVELLTDEVWENDHEEPLAIDKTWTRILIWDTHRAEDRYIRQDITTYALAHSSEWGALDWQQFQDYLHSEFPEDWGEVTYEVHEASELHIYDGEDFGDGVADCDYRYPIDVAWDDLHSAERAAEAYLRRLNPEHLKPII